MTDNRFYEEVMQKYYRRRLIRRRQTAMVSVAVAMVMVVLVAVAVQRETSHGSQIPVDVSGTTTAGNATTGNTTASGSSATTTQSNVGIGGDNPWGKRTFVERFWIGSSFYECDVIDEERYLKWTEQFVFSGGTRDNNEMNMYTYIHEFDIPRDVVKRLCEERRRQRDPAGTLEDVCVLSDEEVDLIYDKTKAEVYAYFVAEYAVVVGEVGYSAEWLATHDADDYRAAGITEQQLDRAYQGMEKWGLDVLLPEEREHVRQQLCVMRGEIIVSTDATATTATVTVQANKVIFGGTWDEYNIDFQTFLEDCGLSREVVEIQADQWAPIENKPYVYTNGKMDCYYEPTNFATHYWIDAIFRPVHRGEEKTRQEICAVAERFAQWMIDPLYFKEYTQTVIYDGAKEQYHITYERTVNGYATYDTMTVSLLTDGQVTAIHKEDLNSIQSEEFPAFDEKRARKWTIARLAMRYPDMREYTEIRQVLTVRTLFRMEMYRISGDSIEPYSNDYFIGTQVVVFEYDVYLENETKPFRDYVAVPLSWITPSL